MKHFLTLILLINFILSYSQTYVFEEDYNNYVEKNKKAIINNYKSIVVIMYKNDKTERGKLFSKETYDTIGNIKTKLEHYGRYRFYEKDDFYYDKSNRLVKIEKAISPFDGNYYTTEIGYKNDDNPFYIIHFFNLGKNHDTLFYSYNDSEKLIYKYFSSRHDTIFYHYDKLDELYHYSNKFNDTSDDRIFNKNGCIIGYKKDTLSGYNDTFTRDSLCNILNLTEEFYYNGKWFNILNGEYKYNGKELIEEKLFANRRNVYKRGLGKLSFWYHTKYEFNDNGSIKCEISLNKRGKIIEVKRYFYETY